MRITPCNYNTEPLNQSSSNYQRAYMPIAKTQQDSVSFGSFKSGVSKWVNKIASGNFFTEFLILDTLSMISPRVWIGLNRDKDKTGQYNYKAGAEEAGREVFSGPSIFLIPMAVMMLFRHYAPASHMSYDSLQSLTSVMNEVTQNSKPEMLKNKAELDKKFAEKLFDKSFGDFDITDKNKLKSQFTDLLTGERSKAKRKEFEELIVKINNSNKKGAPADSLAIEFGKAKTTTLELFEDFHNYSKDVINKLTKQNFVTGAAENLKNNAKEFLEKMQKTRANAKTATAITGFFAVGAFLLYLPKLTQVSKTSPAMESAKRAQKEGAMKAGGANENK